LTIQKKISLGKRKMASHNKKDRGEEKHTRGNQERSGSSDGEKGRGKKNYKSALKVTKRGGGYSYRKKNNGRAKQR